MNLIRTYFRLFALLAVGLLCVVACRPPALDVEPDAGETAGPSGVDGDLLQPSPTPPPATTGDPAPSGDLPVPPLVLNGSQPQGTDTIAGELSYDPDSLLRVDAHRVGGPEEPGAGITAVEFRITSAAGQALYTYVDYAPGFCVFGGGEPTCSSWPLVEGVFRWGEDGPPIEPGQYNGQAVFHLTPENGDGSGDGEEAWRFSFEIARP